MNESKPMKTKKSRYESDTRTTHHGTRIYRRYRKGTWTFKAEVQGKVYYFPLGYDEKAAKALADRIKGSLMIYPISKVRAEFCQKTLARDDASPPTVGQVLETLAQFQKALGWQDSTTKNYFDTLRSMVRRVTGKKKLADVLAYNCGDITPRFMADYRNLMLEGLEDHDKIQSRKRTINKNLRSLKSLFTKKTMKLLKEYDLSFTEILHEEEFYHGLKKQYRLPSCQLIQDTFDLWHRLDDDEFVLLGLALHFGFRRDEAYHARYDWFNVPDDAEKQARATIRAEKGFRPKSGHEGFVLGSREATVAILNKAKGDDYLITWRSNHGIKLFDRTVKKLREIGWTRNNPLHELRKLFGSYVANTESLYVAQKFLRHSSATVTTENYADVITDDVVLQQWSA